MPNSNRITKDWVDIADANFSKKLQPFANAKVVKVLDTAPRTTQEWEALTSYIVDGVTHPFKPGDEVRVPDEDNENGYTYYKLFAITSGVAKWSNSEGNVTSRVKVTVNLDTYVSTDGNTYTKTSGDDVAGTVVTLTENSEGTVVTKTVAAGETSVVFKGIAPFLNYTLSVSAVDRYSQPANQTITNPQIGDELTKTFAYYADEYTFTATSNQDTQSTPDETIAAVKATITYGGESYQKIGTVKFPKDTVLTSITWPDVTGYSKTSSNTGFAYSAEYSTEVLSITSVTSDKTGDDFAGVTFTVNNVTKTYGTDTLTWKVPYGVSDIVTADRTGFGVTITKTPNTDIADSVSKTATIAYEEIKNGVFAYYSDGTLLPYEQADNTAIGVAVIDNDACFVIDKTNAADTTKAFGGYNRDLSNTNIVTSSAYATAKTDFDGYRNTTKIISACAGYTSQSVTGAPAAEACRQQFSGKGYLPALGEWNVAYKYKTDINAMLTDKIGGTALTENWYWASTLYNTSTSSWVLDWDGGSVLIIDRTNGIYVRAFAALNTSISLTLTSSDSTPVSNITVNITDRTGNLQTVTTDSNGQVTVNNVACGDVFVSVPKKQTTNGTFKVAPFSTSFTVGVTTPSTGVYAYYADGSMSTTGTSTAIGVAVITSNCAFVIDKTNIPRADGSATVYYGGYNKDLTGAAMITTDATTATTDFRGQQNSFNIAAACSGYADGYRTGSAAEDCQSRFNGKGYLGSVGEWNDAYQNKTAVNSMMSAIGGTAITESTYWTSTLYNTSTYSWGLGWGYGTVVNLDRINSRSVRAFAAL